MSRRQYKCLETTHKENLEIGTRIHHVRHRWKAPSDEPIIGTIKKMEECDSGIILHVMTDTGEIKLCHVRAHIYGGVMMDEMDCTTKILKSAPHQLDLAGIRRAA